MWVGTASQLRSTLALGSGFEPFRSERDVVEDRVFWFVCDEEWNLSL